MALPKIIAVVGPTAAGKTSLAISLAKVFDGEVISVDSRQVYKGMDIGTAKPDGDKKEDEISLGGNVMQLFGIRHKRVIEDVVHWGFDLVSPDEDYSVVEFKWYAEDRIANMLKRGKVPILAGGTGFWIQAIVDNLQLTEGKPDARLRAELEARHIDDLFAELKRIDPVGAEIIDRKNKRKVVRALEVTKTTGKPFSEQQIKGEPMYDVLQIGVRVDREVLNARINDRVDEMIALGLVNEVRALKETYGCEIESMTGIGYRQICAFLDGQVKLADAVEEVKSDSRRYAKRQMTWFKRDPRIHWVETSEEAMKLTTEFLNEKTPG